MIIKVAITDDHPLVLQGIESMLSTYKEVNVVGVFKTGKETLDNIGKDLPDVLLLDINLPDTNGIDLCKIIIKKHPTIKVLALTNFEENSFVKRILNNGAHGYLLKNTSKIELLEAIKTVLSGEQFLQKDIQKNLLQQSIGQKTNSSFIPKITRREKEVLQAISEELTTQEIADKLYISPKTVETHRMNIMSKLGAKNSVGIIKMAMQFNLLDN